MRLLVIIVISYALVEFAPYTLVERVLMGTGVYLILFLAWDICKTQWRHFNG